MYNPYRKQIFIRAIDVFGEKSQKVQTIEELSELIQAITKEIRQKPGAIENIYEEIGDVEIMLEQLKILYFIDPDKLDKGKDIKLMRLEKDIEVVEGMKNESKKSI